MPATINGTTGFGGNLTGNVTGNVTGTSSAVADGAVSAAKLDGAQSGSAPIYGCRAWVNFDGTKDSTGATSTANTNRRIRGSGNVSSVLRNAAGDYTITFTTPLLDANYATTINVWNTNDESTPASGSIRGTSGGQIRGQTAPTSSAVRIETLYGSSATNEGGLYDFSSVYVAIFR